MFYQRQENYEKAFIWLEKASQVQIEKNKVKKSQIEQHQNEEFEFAKFAAAYQYARTAVFSKRNQNKGIEYLAHYIDNAPEHDELPEQEWAEFRMALLYEQVGEEDKAQSIYKQLVKTEDKRLRKEVKRKL
jgi:tetratricopeptide (TPR) repeat protein